MKYIYEEERMYAKKSNGDLLVEVTFPYVDETTVDLDHVFVDESLRGKGKASKAMKLTYKYLKEKNLKALASCPYVIGWFEKNPKMQDILKK